MWQRLRDQHHVGPRQPMREHEGTRGVAGPSQQDARPPSQRRAAVHNINNKKFKELILLSLPTYNNKIY